MYALDKEQARLLPSPFHSRTLPTFKRYGVANYGVWGNRALTAISCSRFVALRQQHPSSPICTGWTVKGRDHR